MNLQTARQNKNESPQEFADRCRALAQKIVCKVNDPLAQRVHQQNAERMLLATYVAGLMGPPDARYAMLTHKRYSKRYKLLFQWKKLKSKNDSTTAFIRGLKIQSTYTRDRPADRVAITKGRVTQEQNVRPPTRRASIPHVTGKRVARETDRRVLRQHCAVTNARARGIFPENVAPGLGERNAILKRPENGDGLNVRSVQDPQTEPQLQTKHESSLRSENSGNSKEA
jgi:hypothetical protein